MRDDVARAQSDDADPQPTESCLFVGGDDVPVAIQPNSCEAPRSQYRDHRATPWEVGPAAWFLEETGIRPRQQPLQFRPLSRPGVDEFDGGIRAQLLQHRVVGRVLGVEDQSRGCCDGHLL